MTLTDSTKRVWKTLLHDVENEHILAAGIQLCATQEGFPPDLATVRRVAISLQDGELTSETGIEAWGNVVEKIRGGDIELNELERTALKQISSEYDMARSTNLDASRNLYIKAFDALVAKRDLERLTPKPVKSMVARGKTVEPPSRRIAKRTVEMMLPPAETPLNPGCMPSNPGLRHLCYDFDNDGVGQYPDPVEVRSYINQLNSVTKKIGKGA